MHALSSTSCSLQFISFPKAHPMIGVSLQFPFHSVVKNFIKCHSVSFHIVGFHLWFHEKKFIDATSYI
jgi:hypothetical protein